MKTIEQKINVLISTRKNLEKELLRLEDFYSDKTDPGYIEAKIDIRQEWDTLDEIIADLQEWRRLGNSLRALLKTIGEGEGG